MMGEYKFMSYNVASREDLAGVVDLIKMNRPKIVFLQEVGLTTEQLKVLLPRGYTGECNIDVEDNRKPGVATVWEEGKEAEVCNIIKCRMQVVKWGEEKFINVYGPSGTHGQKGRRILYGQDLLQEILALDKLPILVGDWNCVTRPQDVEEEVRNENDPLSRARSQFSRKRSMELKQIIEAYKYSDAFLLNNQSMDFTWLRKGRRKSRLDRVYVPERVVRLLRKVEHILHISDHKAVITTMGMERGSGGNRRREIERGMWKLNSQVLEDRNFSANFDKKLESMVKQQDDFEDLVEWWEDCFKQDTTSFLKDFSAHRMQARGDTRGLISGCLQKAGQEEDWEKVAYCRARLVRMNKEDAMGLIVRSRHQETAEQETASLYHLNREVKRGNKGSLSKLAKEVDQREAPEDEEERPRPDLSSLNPDGLVPLLEEEEEQVEEEDGQQEGQVLEEDEAEVQEDRKRKERKGIEGTGKERQEALMRREEVKPNSRTRKKKKIIVEEREEREELVGGFFSKLFQGYHGENGEVQDEVFKPDFKGIDDLLKGVGELSEEQAREMVQEVNLKEMTDAIEKSSRNKSPGLDGLTYELYKSKKEKLGPLLVEVVNELLAHLKMPKSNREGATRLISKLLADQIPKVTELRPITLLNVDYKLLTMILAGRMEKVLKSLLKSTQSCGVGNITSSAFKILSTVEAIARQGGQAALLSLDLFKAYDRVNLEYVKLVMKKMKFDEVFIDWILLLHDQAKTHLLLDFKMEPIEVNFSVRQGDPIAMILFLIYIEPLLLRLEEAIGGVQFKAAFKWGQRKEPQRLREKVEAYVDDAMVFVTNKEEIVLVDKVMRGFERASGAILNRSAKTKIMGLGDWKGNKRWPLSWVDTVAEMKIFGFVVRPNWDQLLERNWEEQLKSFKETLMGWSSRTLDTLSERAQVVTTFALSKLWYRAQILPLPGVWAAKFEEAVAGFLWRGQITVHLLPQETVCLPKGEGGLGMPYLRAKCESLLLKQTCRMLMQGGGPGAHVNFWLGGRLGVRGMDGILFHQEWTAGGIRDNMPHMLECMRELFSEARDTARIDIFELQSVTAKEIYKSYTETLPPPAVEAKHPWRDWKTAWKRSVNPIIPRVAQNTVFLLLHDRVGTRARGRRLMPGRFESDLCPRCWGHPETQQHRYVDCDWVRDAWNRLRFIMENLDLSLRGVGDREILYLTFPRTERDTAVLWLLGSYLELVEREAIGERRKVSGHNLYGYLKYQKMAVKHLAVPNPGTIPTLDC